MAIHLLGFPRSKGASDIPHIQRIDTLTVRLERARQIVTKGRISAVPNRDGHYIVGTDHSSGFYLVNAEGCCNDSKQDVDLLHGYCEHKLAADLFKEAQGLETAIVSQPEIGEKVKDRFIGSNTYSPEEPPVSKRTRKAQSTRSRKSAASATTETAGPPQPLDSPPVSAINGHSADPETETQ